MFTGGTCHTPVLGSFTSRATGQEEEKAAETEAAVEWKPAKQIFILQADFTHSNVTLQVHVRHI